jgi:hypothetical protein
MNIFEKISIWFFLSIITLLLCLVCYGLYDIHNQLYTTKLLANANVILQSERIDNQQLIAESAKPIMVLVRETGKDGNNIITENPSGADVKIPNRPPDVVVEHKNSPFLTFAVIIAVLQNIIKEVVSFVVGKMREFGTGLVSKLPKKMLRMNFEAFLLLPTTKFPGKGDLSTADLLQSNYHKLLFGFYNLAVDEGVFGGDQNTINTIKQFKDDAFCNKQQYLNKLQATYLNLFPESQNSVGGIYKFYSERFEGRGDKDILFTMQCSYMSRVGCLNTAQLDHCFGVLFSQLIETKGSDIDRETTRDMIIDFAAGCSFLINNDVVKKFTALYQEDPTLSKDKLKSVFKKVFDELALTQEKQSKHT